MKIALYKDTLSNRRGADVAVISLRDGLRECGHEVELFEKSEFVVKIKEKWDVMIATGTNELLDLAEAFPEKFPCPIVMQFHTPPQSQFKWKRFRRNWRIRKALRRVSAIQVLREEFVKDVVKYGVKVVVIGNWSKYENVETCPSNEKVIIYPAAWNKNKNQNLLIAAFERLHKRFSDWTLELYGGGKVPEKLPVGVKAMGYQELDGPYRRCAFVAFPSLDEGFGLVIADAAMFGKPTVLVEDWIGTAKAGGAILASSNVTSFMRGLEILMSDEVRRRISGENAKEYCLSRYSKNKIIACWDSFLIDVIGMSRTR